MNVYIEVDMEGMGITAQKMVRPDHAQWVSRGRQIATNEVNAAIEGALAGGAERVWVKDGHAGGGNLLVESLNKAAELITRSSGTAHLRPGLDSSFDAVFLIGFHARAGTIGGHFDHTISTASIHGIRLNGHTVGEIGLSAAYAGFLGVPVVLVTGDVAAVREASALLGDIETVAVKEAYGRVSARVLSPEIILPSIREAAERALASRGSPWRLDTPLRVEVDFLRSAEADMAEIVPGAERVNGRTVSYEHEDPQMAFKGLYAMVGLAGVAASRWARAIFGGSE
jgi:D-amino peptidase